MRIAESSGDHQLDNSDLKEKWLSRSVGSPQIRLTEVLGTMPFLFRAASMDLNRQPRFAVLLSKAPRSVPDCRCGAALPLLKSTPGDR